MLFKTIKKTYSFVFNLYRCRKSPVNYARSLGVKIGSNVRIIGLNSSGNIFGSEPYLVEIGDHVTITEGVRFVTHDGGIWVFRERHPDCNVFGKITVGNNVFIGMGSIILPNVIIGDNVVIGAGSVITKSIESDSVVAGVPAKTIKTIDEYYQSCMEKLDCTKFNNKYEKHEYLTKKYQ